MLEKRYKLKDGIEVFTQELKGKGGLHLIQFYRINTRDSTYIESSYQTIKFLSLLDGQTSLENIINGSNFDKNGAIKLINFLLDKGLALDSDRIFKHAYSERYMRQIAYFDDLLPMQEACISQEKLENAKIVIFGIGSVGSSMAILLARMGVKNFVFVDYKTLDNSHLIKHLYCNKNNISQMKTRALKDYLLKIDSNLRIDVFNSKIVPQSNLEEFIPKNVDLIINTADEPYIGHLSIKIGRYAWQKNKAFYVAGGFDAHSMSSGEMILPGITPCIDCYSSAFKTALKDYNPTYIVNKTSKNQNIKLDNIVMGGPGSIAACSLFSSSFGVIRIIYYLLGTDCDLTKRGEYLIDKGHMMWTNLGDSKRESCEVCNVK